MNALEKSTLEKIKTLRNQKGISQTKMAEIMGISQTGYAKIENGITESVSLPVAVNIAKALNVGFNELFDIDGDSQKIDSLNNEIEELKKTIEKLNSEISEKSLLNKTLINETSHIKDHIVMQMVSSFQFEVGFIDELILIAEDKDKYIQKREDIIRIFNISKDYYIRTGFLSKYDFVNYYSENKGFYPNLHEDWL